MWIRSQNKEMIIKTDEIDIRRNGKNEPFVIKGNGFTLGEYPTYKKALKVLDMIQEAISVKDYASVSFHDVRVPLLNEKVFQMPQDDEVLS